MGFSTQTTTFKPYCPPKFWLCHSCPHPSSMVYLSFRPFWVASNKALSRQPLCTLQGTKYHFLNVTAISSSLLLNQISNYSTKSLGESDRCNDTVLYQCPYRQSQYAWRELAERMKNQKGVVSGNSKSAAVAIARSEHYKDFQGGTAYENINMSLLPGLIKGAPASNLTPSTEPGLGGNNNNATDKKHNLAPDRSKNTSSSSEEISRKSAQLNALNWALKSSISKGSVLHVTAATKQGYDRYSVVNVGSPTPYNESINTSLLPGLINGGPASNVTPSTEPGLGGNNKKATNNMYNRAPNLSKNTSSSSEQISTKSDQLNALNWALRSSIRKDCLMYVPAFTKQGYDHKSVDSVGSTTPRNPRQKHLSSTHASLKVGQPSGSLSRNPSAERKETNPEIDEGIAGNGTQRDADDGISAATADVANEDKAKGTHLHEWFKRNHRHERLKRTYFHERLKHIYDKVLLVDNISVAKEIVGMLTNQYRHLVHACDTEVAKIDVKQETPVDHGEIICFSVYSGPEVNFGNGKSCIWVDVLDGGGRSLLAIFAPFFKDPSIKKVWHNYSFDNHVIENYGLKVSGFHADTMHMARLWDSSRRMEGGYSLEALTADRSVMSDAILGPDEKLICKVSMKSIFGRIKVKKDGSEGKVITIPPVEELQRLERKPWVCYSALDSIITLKLYESLKSKLCHRVWKLDGVKEGSMFDFYEKYWRPFGELLVRMETGGMLVDRAYLAAIEKVAKADQQVAADSFRKWASKYCSDAKDMNVGSDAQLRQLFFGGIENRKNPKKRLPKKREFKILNIDGVIEEGKKTATKFRKITLHSIGVYIQSEMYTATGWPSLSGDALKTLAGKVSAEFSFTDEASELQPDDNVQNMLEPVNGEKSEAKGGAASERPDVSAYGTAYTAFGGGAEGMEACHAIAALCEICSIDSLISNFILPLQGSHVSGKNGRIHCSLNINTETGRLSSRRPNLQNQPALEKDRYKIRQAFIAAPGNSLIVADYGQLELRILAHLANCKSMLDAFKAGGDFHSRTAMNMYPYIHEAVEQKHVLLEWHPQCGEDKPPVPLLKDAFASERRKAKMLNFSIAYGKTVMGLANDWKVSEKEAKETVDRWYSERREVLSWQERRKEDARINRCVHTLLGRVRWFPSMNHATSSQIGHIERAAINTPVQGSAADVAMCAMLEIEKNSRLKDLGWKLLLQVHDEVILEGPTESAEDAKAIVVECMSKPFDGKNILRVELSVDAKCAQNWYFAK